MIEERKGRREESKIKQWMKHGREDITYSENEKRI